MQTNLPPGHPDGDGPHLTERFAVTIRRPGEHHDLTISTTTRQHLGRIIDREKARGSEVVKVTFPEDDR